MLFSPVHTGLAQGQPSVLCIALITCAFYLPPLPRRGYIAGILLGLACCLKPNIAIPFILLCAWRREWSTVLTSFATAIPVFGIGLARLQTLHTAWWQD